jgi:hypothetical protein
MASSILADNGVSSGSAGIKTTADSTGALALQTTTAGGAATTAVTIDASQNVGIGTSSPSSKLTVDGGNAAIKTGNKFYLWNTANDNAPYLKHVNGGIGFFNTSDSQAMQTDSSGNLLVGTTSQLSNGKTSVYQASGGCAIEAQIVGSGTAYAVMTARVNNTANLFHAFYYNTYSSGVGSISTNGTVTAYNISSDYRLKENIVPLTGALDKITQLKPSVYNYKSKPEEAIEGFVAHELQAVVPHAVTGEKDAVDANGNPVYQGVDASFLIPHLVAAIQEQQALITTLTERISALEAK